MKYLITYTAQDGFTFGCDAYEIVEDTEAEAVMRAQEIECQYPEGDYHDTRPVNVYELGRKVV